MYVEGRRGERMRKGVGEEKMGENAEEVVGVEGRKIR